MLATHGLRRAARIRGQAPSISFEGRAFTWRQTEDRVARAAAALRALGLSRGDRVAVLSENSLAYFELYWAAAWGDLILAGLNTRWALPEMIAAAADCTAKVLVADRGFAAHAKQIAEALPHVEHILYTDDGEIPAGMRSYEALLAANAPMPDQERGGGETVFLFYTSGTTGTPKGAMLTAANVFSAGLMIANPFALSPSTRALCVMPMFHVGAGTFLIGLAFAASEIVLHRRYDPRAALTAIAERRITHSVLVPAMINQILSEPDAASFDLSSVERLIYGGAPMPEALLARAMQVMPKVGFNQGYSMTETTATGTTLLPRDHDPSNRERMRSVGQPIAGNDLEIRDEAGNAVPANSIGEICIRGPSVMAGYWRKPEETARAFHPGRWYRTGDAGRLDAQGYLYIVDRLKDMIITGGENVYSAEVENALYAHPAILECAVIGMPDEKWGERVCAIVRLKPDASATAEDLLAHCRTLIGGYKAPRQIIFSAEPLPKSGAAKILKPALRAMYRPD